MFKEYPSWLDHRHTCIYINMSLIERNLPRLPQTNTQSTALERSIHQTWIRLLEILVGYQYMKSWDSLFKLNIETQKYKTCQEMPVMRVSLIENKFYTPFHQPIHKWGSFFSFKLQIKKNYVGWFSIRSKNHQQLSLIKNIKKFYYMYAIGKIFIRRPV